MERTEWREVGREWHQEEEIRYPANITSVWTLLFINLYFFFYSEEISRLSPTSETLILRWPEMVQKIILRIVS